MASSTESVAPLRLDDQAGFRAFYSTCLPLVYGYFLSRCGYDRPTAEDLTQDTFMAAVRNMGRDVTISAPLPWIMGVAHHKLVDHWRAQERDDRRLTAVESETSVAAATELLEWDEAGGTERAARALARVPTAQRAALVLHHVDGMTVSETATRLGRSESAVESLLARGRASFRAAYREVGDE